MYVSSYTLLPVQRSLICAQVFLLIDEATVRRYKADLTDEIEPQINELISRAEKGLQILLKRESMLRAKVCQRIPYYICQPDSDIG